MTPPRRGRGLTVFLWVVVGLVAAFALASIISVGLFILPFPIAGAILLLSRPRKVVAAAVLLAAAGVAPLLLAYLNRPGPGHICHTYTDGVACGDYPNPWHWLTLGAVLWLGSGILYARPNADPRQTGDAGAGPEVVRPVSP